MKPARRHEPDFEESDFELAAIEPVELDDETWIKILALLIQAGQEDQ